DEHWVWRIDDAKAAKLLEEKLLDPLSQAFHEHPEHVRALWAFLLDAALCGELVPANLLLGVQALAEEVEDDLADSIDEILVERFGVFEDLEYSHPGFPASVNVYRFREPIVRLAVLEHFQVKERKAGAAQIAPALRRGLLVTTRDVARLFLTLADHLGEEERDEILRDLAWWVGMEEADDLRDGLGAALAEGWLKPETLWGAIEGTEGRWPAYRRLALLDAYGTGPRDEEGNPLGVPMERLGRFHFLRARLLLNLGRYQEAQGNAELAVRVFEAQSGRQSLPFLTASVLVGDLLRLLGDFTRAQNTLRQALDWAEKLIGPEHLETLAAKYQLARVLEAQGELSRSREMSEEVLAAEIRLIGPEHHNTLTTKHALAGLLQSQGELFRSREMCEEVLEARVRLLGPEHPYTLASKHNLAGVLEAQGELSRSREMSEEVLAAEIRLLGPEHPHTLMTKHNLARVLEAQGELSRSREMFEEVLAAEIRLLGPEHPHTLTTKHNLARVLQAQGELSRFREMYEEVLEARIRILGPEHFRTKEIREALRKLDERSTSSSGEATAEPGA
ncbi:MAG TPA: tetratricopeptide repeat protein, partial [Thermoanaerobaculia bacterium]|nr:tetratricopeptide repeat protein [Thermoanaerobaculia bacterium]